MTNLINVRQTPGLQMFNSLTFFSEFFFKKSEELPDLTLNCHIDAKKIFAELSLERKAIETAQYDLPVTESTVLDGNEMEICSYTDKQMAKINNIANEKLSRYNTAIADTNLRQEQARIENLTESTKLKIKGLLEKESRQLEIHKQDRDEIENDYQQFRSANGLHRAPHYPTSKSFHFAIILSILLIESVFNSYFFAKGSDFGLLGGFLQALTISGLNITTAVIFLSSLMRNIHHVSLLRRLISLLCFLVLVVTMICFNLFVAHYRDFFAGQPELAAQLAIEQFVNTPFKLTDIDSWLLFGVGLIASTIAFIDGYNLDDPYPGYGKIHRRLLDVQFSYEQKRTWVVDQIEALRWRYLSELDAMKDQVNTKFTWLFNLAGSKQAFIQKHHNFIANWLTAGSALIQKYRQINMAHRTTPPPEYFKSRWEPNQVYNLIGAEDDSGKINDQQDLHRDFPHFIQKRINEIEVLYIAFFQLLQKIDSSIKPEKSAPEVN